MYSEGTKTKLVIFFSCVLSEQKEQKGWKKYMF